MKKRLSRVVNFVAFNLLFFALYLNFIHKDSNTISTTPSQVHASAAVSQTVLVENPAQYLKKDQPATNTNNNQIAKTTIN